MAGVSGFRAKHVLKLYVFLVVFVQIRDPASFPLHGADGSLATIVFGTAGDESVRFPIPKPQPNIHFHWIFSSETMDKVKLYHGFYRGYYVPRSFKDEVRVVFDSDENRWFAIINATDKYVGRHKYAEFPASADRDSEGYDYIKVFDYVQFTCVHLNITHTDSTVHIVTCGFKYSGMPEMRNLDLACELTSELNKDVIKRSVSLALGWGTVLLPQTYRASDMIECSVVRNASSNQDKLVQKIWNETLLSTVRSDANTYLSKMVSHRPTETDLDNTTGPKEYESKYPPPAAQRGFQHKPNIIAAPVEIQGKWVLISPRNLQSTKSS